MIFLSLIQLSVSLFALLYAIKVLKSGLPSLLAIHLILIIVLVSLGVALAPYFPIETLSYVNNPNTVSLIRDIEPAIYFRQCLGHWLFLCVAIVGLRWEKSWPTMKPNKKKRARRPISWGYMIFILGILLSIKYYLFGPGWTILRSTELVFSSTSEAVAHRVLGYQEAGFGQGNYMASVAAYIFFPLSAAIITLKKNRLNWIFFVLAAVNSLAYAFQTRQKAPLLWTVITYLLLLYLSKRESRHKRSFSRMLTASVLVGSVGSVVLYMVNFGHSLQSAVERFFCRLFLVPASSETNFFVIFPDSFPFRGIAHVFEIPLGRTLVTDMVSIYDVARAATGEAHAANASFLAVAWSATGFTGVLIVSLFLVVSLVFLDRAFSSMDRKFFYIALALSPIYMISIISDGISTYIGRGGVIVPLMLFLMTKAPALSFKTRR